jgi:hypothetical protein
VIASQQRCGMAPRKLHYCHRGCHQAALQGPARRRGPVYYTQFVTVGMCRSSLLIAHVRDFALHALTFSGRASHTLLRMLHAWLAIAVDIWFNAMRRMVMCTVKCHVVACNAEIPLCSYRVVCLISRSAQISRICPFSHLATF